jgi:hypothetical protein
MVQFSKRKALLRQYEKEWKERAESAIARWMLDIDDPIEDAVDMYFAECCVNEINQRQYLFRSLKNCRRHGKIPEFLKEMGVWDSWENLGAEDHEDDSSGHDSSALSSCIINDNDFLQEFCVLWKSFKALHDLINDHPVFNRGRRGPKQEPSEFQLLIFLRFVGQCGDGNSSHRMKLFSLQV